MATRRTIGRISERIDELAARMGVHRGPVYVVVGEARDEQGQQAAISRHLERCPGDRDREMIVIVTGVPRARRDD
jgi:hypothetical protein